MSFKIVRNDITKMDAEAIVNTANDHVAVGTGCDSAVYQAASYEKLLQYRKEKIGFMPEGEAFLTPGFGLKARYIIHAVSPAYLDGKHGEEEKLRSCYRKSLLIAAEKGIRSLAFPLIGTGSFGYPKEEGMRIAVDEIQGFLRDNDMEIYLVVFDAGATRLGEKLYPDLESYIDSHYVEAADAREYGACYLNRKPESAEDPQSARETAGRESFEKASFEKLSSEKIAPESKSHEETSCEQTSFDRLDEDRLEERMRCRTDTFSQYLLQLIREKDMGNAEVYERAIVDRKIFSKIKNNADYHPNKLTALASRFMIIQMPIITKENLEKLIQEKYPAIRPGYKEQFASLFGDIRRKCEGGEISTKALDLRGLLAAIRMMERGLPAMQALELGIVNKCFEEYERQLVRDMITVRFSGDLRREQIFAS